MKGSRTKRRAMWDEGKLKRPARDSHGLLDRATIRRLGLSDHQIDTARRLRMWKEVHPGVFYLNATAMTWESRLLAAVLSAGPGSLASHRSASRLWMLDGFRSGILELTVPYSDRPLPQGTVVHRTRRPRPGTLRKGIPVTTVERTLLDLAGLLTERAVSRAVESALRQRLTTPGLVRGIIKSDGGRGVTGTKALRRVLARVEQELTGSIAESDFRDLLGRASVPVPIFQLKVDLPNGDVAYPDFAWPELGKLIEVDGFMAHSTPDQLQHDLRRQNLLMELGWQIRRFSARDVRDRPSEVIDQIIRFIGS